MLYQCVTDYAVLTEQVHMMKRHVHHRLMMPQTLTAWGWNLKLQESKLVCVISHTTQLVTWMTAHNKFLWTFTAKIKWTF